jgi:tRNA/tmRNA/rRNA uracil-C5-methylase (TrmA/RlmC/RlmD family)
MYANKVNKVGVTWGSYRYRANLAISRYRNAHNVADGMEIDHKFSVFVAWCLNIPSEIVNSFQNMTELIGEDNLNKGAVCSITLEELMSYTPLPKYERPKRIPKSGYVSVRGKVDWKAKWTADIHNKLKNGITVARIKRNMNYSKMPTHKQSMIDEIIKDYGNVK